MALLELIQDTVATDARLVAQCPYDRVDCGNQVAAVTEALGDGLKVLQRTGDGFTGVATGMSDRLEPVAD